MAFPFAALLGTLGSAITGFFGFKQNQADALKGALSVLGDINSSNSQREQSIATIIAAEATSGYWLAAVWRPLLMLVFAGILVSYWFGYGPPNIDGPMPQVLGEIFDLLKIGIGGYIGGRTLEKIMAQINLSGVLKSFIEKKLG